MDAMAGEVTGGFDKVTLEYGEGSLQNAKDAIIKKAPSSNAMANRRGSQQSLNPSREQQDSNEAGGINDSFHDTEPGCSDLNDLEMGGSNPSNALQQSVIGTADVTHKNQKFNEEGILEYQPIIADGYLAQDGRVEANLKSQN